jgi:hypothetical protein
MKVTWIVPLAGALGCAFAVLVGVPFGDELRREPLLLHVMTASTALFAAVVVRCSLDGKSMGSALKRVFGVGMLLGAANAVFGALVMVFTHGDFGALPYAVIGGSIVGSMVAVGYALGLAPLVAVGWHAKNARSLADEDRGARGAAIWLITVVFLLTSVRALAGIDMLAPLAIAVALFGFIVIAVASERMRRRQRFIERVLAGAIDGWRIRPIASGDPVPWLRLEELADGVLEIDANAPAQSPYRDRSRTLIVAIAPTVLRISRH